MTKPSAENLLEVDNLSVEFNQGKTRALSGVSFVLRKNEILGIVGETGAGKSILARSLINLLPEGGRVAGGDVRIDGQSVFTMSTEEQRQFRGGRIALIGTNPKALLDPVRRIGAQVADVLRAHKNCSAGEARRTAIELLDRVGIVNPERRSLSYPHQLSGGMAQRVIIAMALVARPEIVVADDATLGLDATIQVQVLDLLVERCRELNLAVVLITHDLGIVSRYCNRVAVMKKGRVVELKNVTDFLVGAEQPESIALLAAARVRPTPIASSPEALLSHRPLQLLKISNLFKAFPVGGSREVVQAVDDVSFSVAKGQTLALVGESGSGKTTIGQCLVRLLASDSGSIVFDGQDVTNFTEREFRPLRKRIQMVFQEPYVALNPRWQVESLIAEPLELISNMESKERAHRVSELLDLVQLPSSIRRLYPHQLTAGEQKRIGIARALATEPDFVVFDEPTTALDIRVRAQIIDLIRDLQARMGLSALFITHDLNSVRSLAHFVAVMQRGKIIESGETEKIFAEPSQQYTKMLLGAELPIEDSLDTSNSNSKFARSKRA